MTDPPKSTDLLYPNYLLPVAGTRQIDPDDFDLARERLLLGYGYQTARAYWRDLEDWRDWCAERADVTNPLRPSMEDVDDFLSDRLRAGYSPNTVARRLTTLRAFFDLNCAGCNPARTVGSVPRRRS